MQNIELYAYLDISNPMVEWEVAIGRIASSCDVSRRDFGVSLWFYNNIKNKIIDGRTNHFINEMNLELVRQRNFPNSVSRMTGVYFFDSEKMLKNAFLHWGININSSYISKVMFSADSLSIVDSEWITQNINSIEGDNSWMSSYWSGESYWEKPVTEYIASGIGIIANNELRKTAYNSLLKKFPRFSKILAFSAAKFFYGIDNAGQVVPAILSKNGKLTGSYCIDLNSFKGEEKPSMDEILEYCQAKGVNFPYNPIFDTSPDIHLPDFDGRFEFDSKQALKLYNSVHGI